MGGIVTNKYINELGYMCSSSTLFIVVISLPLFLLRLRNDVVTDLEKDHEILR